MRHRLAMVGVAIIAFISFLAIIGNEQAALQQNLRMGFTNQPPGAIPGYPLGTDALGRDVLSRTLVGGRVSILVAIVSVAIATGIGTTVGVLSGYAGGWLDQSLMRFVDIVLSFPTILLLLVVALLVGPGLTTLVIMIGLVTWASGARIVRGQVLSLREFTFIEAARVIGVPTPRMITTHILPNIVAPLVVFATFGVASVIVFEASLSYLGLGVQPPTPSVGQPGPADARGHGPRALPMAVGARGLVHRADGARRQLRGRRAARRVRPALDLGSIAGRCGDAPDGSLGSAAKLDGIPMVECVHENIH